MICKYCGQPIEDGKSFCTSCGAFNESSSESEQKKPLFTPISPSSMSPFSGKGKAAISKTKTPFFWASKAAFIIAIVLYFMPFVSFSFKTSSMFSSLAKPITMSGRELVFGVDDDKNSTSDSSKKSESKLTNGKVMIAFILVIASLVMPRSSAYTGGVAALLLIAFTQSVEKNYTFMGKTIKDWDGLIKADLKPALYLTIVVLIVGTVLAAWDEIRRTKMYQQELLDSVY